MGKDRDYCILDEMKRGLYRQVIDSFEDIMAEMQDSHPVPEKDSPLAKYGTKEVIDEKCVTPDGQTFYMETFMPDATGSRKLPVIVDIHGGGFVREDRRYRRQYLKALASRGFLVFSFDYILSDDTSVTRELKDICSIIDVISGRLKDFRTDPERVYMTGDSAGAYLALYVAAMSSSEKLRDVIGCDGPALKFTALGLHSGMFYIDRCDLSGFALSKFECGMSEEEREFQKYIDPECEEVITNLPPVFLSTSRGDFFNDYTLSFHEALKKAGKRTRLVYRGSSELIHSYAAVLPNLPESIDVIDMMIVWFEEQTEEEIRKDLSNLSIEDLAVYLRENEVPEELIEFMMEYPEARGVFHCCSGSPEMAEELLRRGWYLGFDGPITYKNARRAPEVAAVTPLERMVVETDSPYLSPAPNRGRRNDSRNLRYIVETLAAWKGVSPEELARVTLENGKRLFGLA